MANRILFGNINLNAISVSVDMNQREMATLLPLVFLVLLMGLYPNIFLDVMHVSCSNLIQGLRLFFEVLNGVSFIFYYFLK